MRKGKPTDDYLKFIMDIDGKPAQNGLAVLSTETNELKKANQALNTEMQKLAANGQANTNEFKKLKAQYDENNRTIKQSEDKMRDLRKEIGLNSLSMTELKKHINDTKKALSGATPGTAEWKKHNSELQAAKARYAELDGAGKKVNGTFGAIKTSTLAVIGVITGLIASFGGLVGNIIEVYGEFEKYRSVLTNTFGSQDKANEAMAMLQDTAAKLPVSLREVTEGFIKMVNRGFTPTQQEIIKLSDLASSQGKSLDQFIEAMLDAQTGEFERLKEFGIRAKSEGDKVTFTFKGQTETVQKTDKAIQEYLLRLGEIPGVAGSSAAVMNTLQGKISNLGDSWDQLLVAMGENGFGKLAKNIIALTSDIVSGFTSWIAASPAEMLEESRIKLQAEQIQLNSSNLSHDDRVTLINKLKEEYPAYLGHIDAETASNEELNKILNKVNEDLINKIVLQKADEEIQKKQNDIAQAKLNMGENEIKLNKQIAETAKEQGLTVRKELGDTYKVAEDLQKQLKQKRGLDPAGLLGGDTDLSGVMQQYSIASGMYNKYMAEGNGLAEHRNELMKTLNLGLYDQNAAMKKTAEEAEAQRKKEEAEKNAAEQKAKEEANKRAEEEKKKLKKRLEDQQKARLDLINSGITEREKEYGRYREHLQKLGLMDENYVAKKGKLTIEEQEAQRIALERHLQNLSDIDKKEAEAALKAKQEQAKKEADLIRVMHSKALDELELAENQKLLTEGRTQADRDRIHSDFNNQREAKELAHLILIKAIYTKAGLDTLDIDKQINKERLKQYEQGNKDLERLLKDKEELLSKYNNGEVDQLDSEESNELTKLQELWDAKLLTEEEYLMAQDGIHELYTAKRLERDSNYLQQGMELQQQMSNAVTGLKDLELAKLQTAYQKDSQDLDRKYKTDIAALNKKLKSGQISEEQFTKQKEALDRKYSESKTNLEEQHAEKEKAIKKRFANAEFALKVAEIIGNTAVAVMKGFAQLGPVGGAISAALLSATGAVQIGIANEQRAQVMQLARGKYNVLGAEDGKTYNNVPLVQSVQTGLITSPTLMAEEPEIAVDIKTTRFAMLNYPQLLGDLRLLRQGIVPQRAEGKYDVVEKQATPQSNTEMLSFLATNIQVLNSLYARLQTPIDATIYFGPKEIEDFDKERDKIAVIKNDANRYT